MVEQEKFAFRKCYSVANCKYTGQAEEGCQYAERNFAGDIFVHGRLDTFSFWWFVIKYIEFT